MAISMNDLYELTDSTIIERGKEYYLEGRVRIIENDGEHIKAIVEGTDDYEVDIELEKLENAICTCPYGNSYSGACKHTIAVLMEVINGKTTKNKTPKKSKTKSEGQQIHEILSNVNKDELIDFIESVAEKNKEFEEKLRIRFAPKSIVGNTKDYKKEIKQMFKKASDNWGFLGYGSNVDFSKYYNKAEELSNYENHTEAAKIYQAISESIAETMSNIDDSDGYYGGEFSFSVEEYVEAILSAKLSSDMKKEYIDYLFKMYIKNDPDYFEEEYYTALMDICTKKEDYLYLEKKIKGILPNEIPSNDNRSDHYTATRRFYLYAFLLRNSENNQEFYKLMNGIWDRNHDLCMLYINALNEDGKVEEAIKNAEKGLIIFNRRQNQGIRDFLVELYEESDTEKYIATLIDLFIDTKDYEYYDRLKAAIPSENWQDKFLEIEKIFIQKAEDYDLIDLYLKEESSEKAIEIVCDSNSIGVILSYHKELAEMFPEKYFDAYLRAITAEAAAALDRGRYKKVGGYLKKMKSIKGFKAKYSDFVRYLMETYKRRPAFIDELSKV